MTTAQLQLEAGRLVKKFSRRELGKLVETIEDLVDAREAARISKRIREGKDKTVPWETVKARLEKRFANS